MSRLTICLLGPFTALLDGVPLTGFRSDKVRALLAYLAVEAHRPWTRATLAELLWPDFPEKAVQSNLRNAISNLRSVIRDQGADAPFLKVDQETIQFNLASDYRLDVKEFLDLISRFGDSDPVRMGKQAALPLLQALQLYQGDLLEGFSVSSAPFEEWVLLNGEHIRQKALGAVRLLVGWYERTGDLSQALHHARFWLKLEPWDEGAHRAIIRILAQQGHRVAALAQYETCRQQLKSNLGIEPEPATVRLYEQVRDGQVLNLHLSLGPALTATVGWGAPELEKNYREAEDLLEKMHDDARLVPALWLLAVYHLGRSEHQAVDRLVERLARLANEVRDPGLSSLASLQVSPLYQASWLRRATSLSAPHKTGTWSCSAL